MKDTGVVDTIAGSAGAAPVFIGYIGGGSTPLLGVVAAVLLPASLFRPVAPMWFGSQARRRRT